MIEPEDDTGVGAGELPLEPLAPGSGRPRGVLSPPMNEMRGPAPSIATYSLLAFASGIASIASVGACLIAAIVALTVSPSAALVVLILPIVAFGGAIMGLVALGRIRRSGGRLGGRPLATMGLFVGLGAGVLQSAFTISALVTIWPVRSVLAPEVDRFMQRVSIGELDRAREQLAESVRPSISDAQLLGFGRVLESRIGEYQNANFGIDVFIESRTRVRSLLTSSASPGAPSPTNAPRPIGLKFADTRAIGYVFVDQDALRGGRVLLEDILVLLPDDRAVILRADADASLTAAMLGAEVIPLTGVGP